MEPATDSNAAYSETENVTVQNVEGTEHDDYLSSQGDNHLFNAGKGDDYIDSYYESDDIYIFNPGDGNDTIYDAGGKDKIVFGEGIRFSHLRLIQNEWEATLFIYDDAGNPTGDSITININEDDGNIAVEDVVLADGSQYSMTDIAPLDEVILNGSDGDDFLYSHGNVEHTFNAGKGDDYIDSFYGTDDSYIFNLGDGNDIIYDDGGEDKIIFGEGIHFSNLRLMQLNEWEVVLFIFDDDGNPTGDSITININEDDGTIAIEDVVLADGSQHLITDIAPLDEAIINGSNRDDYLYSHDNVEHTFNAGKGDDFIYSSYETDDTYIFNPGDGNDTIYDAGGKDKIVFGEGIRFSHLRLIQNEWEATLFIYDDAGNPTGDSITININEGDGTIAVEDVVLADGSQYSMTDIAPLDEVILNGSDEDDYLYSHGNVEHTFNAGKGDDYIDSFYGTDDSYIFNLGDGNDIIYDNGGEDKIVFGEGIHFSNLRLMQLNEWEAVLFIFDDDGNLTGDSITININGNNGRIAIEQVVFADGSEYAVTDVALSDVTIIQGSGIDDYLSSEGEDNHIFNAGKGNDYIDSWHGTDDIYLFNFGDGQDIINDDGGNDTIAFGKGISLANLQFTPDGHDLLIELINAQGYLTGDSVLICNGMCNSIEHFTLAGDDTTYHLSDFVDMISHVEVNGTDDSDYLYSEALVDKTFNGGKGDDLIESYQGTDDAYLFNPGDGQDIIFDDGGNDSIVFGEGITFDRVRVFRDGFDTHIIIMGEDGQARMSGDRITIIGGDYSRDYLIENIVFSDGQQFKIEALLPLENIAIEGTDSSDYLRGTGEEVDYIFNGGKGDDTIDSFYGTDDTYLFNPGDGQDVIYDNGGNDTIAFGEGITFDRVRLFRDGRDVHIIVIGDDGPGRMTDDRITLYSADRNSDYLIENFVFSDGRQYSIEELLPLKYGAIEGTDGADYLRSIAEGLNYYFNGGKGNDTIDSLHGTDDTYIFNPGDGQDTIYDYEGNDTILFGEGICSGNIKVVYDSYDIQLVVIDEHGKPTGDSITICDANSDEAYLIEHIAFADGSHYTIEQLAAVVTESAVNEAEPRAMASVPQTEANVAGVIQAMSSFGVEEAVMSNIVTSVPDRVNQLAVVGVDFS